MNSEAAKNDVLLELALRQSYWNTAESQESKSNWVRVLASSDTADQQIRPALVELAKAMGTTNDELDVSPVVEHLDATVRSALAQDNVELDVWQAIVDRLPNETQVRWAERLAALKPVQSEIQQRTPQQAGAATVESCTKGRVPIDEHSRRSRSRGARRRRGRRSRRPECRRLAPRWRPGRAGCGGPGRRSTGA